MQPDAETTSADGSEDVLRIVGVVRAYQSSGDWKTKVTVRTKLLQIGVSNEDDSQRKSVNSCSTTARWQGLFNDRKNNFSFVQIATSAKKT